MTRAALAQIHSIKLERLRFQKIAGKARLCCVHYGEKLHPVHVVVEDEELGRRNLKIVEAMISELRHYWIADDEITDVSQWRVAEQGVRLRVS